MYKIMDAFSLEKAMTGGGQSEIIQFSQFLKIYFHVEYQNDYALTHIGSYNSLFYNSVANVTMINLNVF